MSSCRVSREFYFDASHYLPGYKGKCEQFHGHTYRLEVSVEGKIGKDGMVMDFNELKTIVNDEVIEALDHKNLNEIFKNPTAENITVWIYNALEKKMPGISSVRLWEGHGKWVEITRDMK